MFCPGIDGKINIKDWPLGRDGKEVAVKLLIPGWNHMTAGFTVLIRSLEEVQLCCYEFDSPSRHKVVGKIILAVPSGVSRI